MVFKYVPTENLSDKVAIVTGGSSGIGKITCYELAKLGAHVFVAARDEQKTIPIIEDIKSKTGNSKVEFLLLKLDHLQSVKEAAHSFLEKKLPLHLLINNAGVAGDYPITKDVDLNNYRGMNVISA